MNNNTNPATSYFTNPHPVFDRPDAFGIYRALVRTVAGGGYTSLADAQEAEAAGLITIVSLATPQTALDYGRTSVHYRIR